MTTEAKNKMENPWFKIVDEDNLTIEECPGCGMKKVVCQSIINCYRSVAVLNRRNHKSPQISPGDVVKVLSSRDAVYGNVVAESIGGTKYGDVRVRVIKSNSDVSDNYPVGRVLAVYTDDLEKIDNPEKGVRQ